MSIDQATSRAAPASRHLVVAAALLMLSLAASLPAPKLAAAASHRPRAGGVTGEAAALAAEVRKSFTVHGKPIPPEIFRDMGDGDMADSGSIWVTVDVAAAVGSNLYYDDIRADHGWFTQKTRDKPDEETAYRYVGATDNGLLAVIAVYSGGGSGRFFTLHILDVVAARGFDLDGRLYPRVNLTVLRSVALGDRWDGEARIAGNAIVVTKLGPGVGLDSGQRPTVTITALRP